MMNLKLGRTFTLCKFAKLLNYQRASNREFKRILKWLETNGYVIVQQGGFLGDNLHHPKIVAIQKSVELDTFRRVILTRVNYSLADYQVHRTKDKRKCEKCKQTIEFGERYGSQVIIGRKILGKKRGVVLQSVICLPCLLERVVFEDLEGVIV